MRQTSARSRRRFADLAGGSSSLAFGWVDEACPGLPFGLCEMCNPLGSCPLTIEGGGVSLVTPGVKPTAVPGITPPALFAVAEGRVAVAPARSPASPAGLLPRITEDGRVEVFDFSGRLLARISLVGLVRGIAMTGHKVTVLLERPEGDRGFSASTPAPARTSPAAHCSRRRQRAWRPERAGSSSASAGRSTSCAE